MFLNFYASRLRGLINENGIPESRTERRGLNKAAKVHALKYLKPDQTWIRDDLVLWSQYFGGTHKLGPKKITRPPSVMEQRGHLVQVVMASTLKRIIDEAKKAISTEPMTVGNVESEVDNVEQEDTGHTSAKDVFVMAAESVDYQPFAFPLDIVASGMTGHSVSAYTSARYGLRHDDGWTFERKGGVWLVTPVKPVTVDPILVEVAEVIKQLPVGDKEALRELLRELL